MEMSMSMLILPSISSSSTSTTLRAFRTLYSSLSVTTSGVCLFRTKTPPSSSSLLLLHALIPFRSSSSSHYSSPNSVHRLIPGFSVPKCISSVSSCADTLDWNDPVSCSSEVGDANDYDYVIQDDDTKPSIPVRAYFFSTRSPVLSLSLSFSICI